MVSRMRVASARALMPRRSRRRKAKLIGRRTLGAWDFADGSDLGFRNPWARKAGSGSPTGSGELRKNGRASVGPSADAARASRRGPPPPLPEPPDDCLDQGAISLVASQVAKSLDADQALVHHQPIEHLLEEARLFAADLEAQQEEGLGVRRPAIAVLGGRQDPHLRPLVSRGRRRAGPVRSSLASEIGIPDSHVGEHLAKDLRVDRIAEQEGRCHRTGWSLCWLRCLTSRNEMSLTRGSIPLPGFVEVHVPIAHDGHGCRQ